MLYVLPGAYARNLENAIIKSVLVHDVQIQKIRLREFILYLEIRDNRSA